jgi:hypothetical protein
MPCGIRICGGTEGCQAAKALSLLVVGERRSPRPSGLSCDQRPTAATSGWVLKFTRYTYSCGIYTTKYIE